METPPAPTDSSNAALAAALEQALRRRTLATAQDLAAAIGRSQPTVSRLLAALEPAPVVLGRGRNTRYGWPQPIHGKPARQPLYWVHEDGHIETFGQIHFIAGARVHLAAPGLDLLVAGRLPWLLAPLRAEGFLGRALAQQLSALGLADSPERWPLEHQLFAALHQPDGPGALVLGEPTRVESPLLATIADYEVQAEPVARALPKGSSAAGEQPKFLGRRAADGAAVLVKFTPPRGTPFGERWHSLLHLEALALDVLARWGVPAARTRVLEGPKRTFLESERFDRVGAEGRRHVVPLWALHEAFVSGSPMNWGATLAELARQRRLSAIEAERGRALHQFGRLIGNTDMHFGNLSVLVSPADAAAGRFTLAPLYDMLPMRWRPDVMSGELGLLPFAPEPLDLQSAARAPALEFWQRASRLAALDAEMRGLAAAMASRLAP